MKLEEVRQACKRIPAIVWAYRSLRLLAGALILTCLRATRPWATIRIGLLHYDRLGHLAANTEYWLRKEYPKRLPREKFFLLFPANPANLQLITMIGRVVPVIKSTFLYRIMSEANRRWPQLSLWIDMRSTGTHDYGLWAITKPQLTFTDEEMLRGNELLRRMGVPDGSPYVCFAMRDKTYLDTQSFAQSWRYHDYRDVNIDHCHLMAEWLASQEIWVLRMGAVVEKYFGSDNPRIIDYANRYRSDFGDIFLLGHCKFFVGDTAGIFWPAAILGVPVVLTNLVPITHLSPIPGSMILPKKYRHRSSQEFISYREVVRSCADGFVHSREYDEAGIELIENTPEEMLDIAREMNGRIDGNWFPAPDDEELQAHFWSIFPPGHPSHGCPARVPIDFLRRNPELTA